MINLPKQWDSILHEEYDKPYFHQLGSFLNEEYARGVNIWPAPENIFKAYELCKPEDVKVVIIGQDPYPNHHAHGLSFSTTQERRPLSLHYIFKEICENYPEYDIEKNFPTNNLTCWAKQGVFLLNSVLTVREKHPNSHANKGWEEFTKATLRELVRLEKPIVILLWGKYAEKMYNSATAYGDMFPHGLTLVSGHPAAAAYGKNLFSGNKHFKLTNNFLESKDLPPIIWKT